MIERVPSGSSASHRAAIVFVHGFTGDRRATWGDVPTFLEADQRLTGWDFYCFGYESRRRFDVPNLWSADARIEEIATMLWSVPELAAYESLSFVAHSMGGLVVQRALVKYPDLRSRTSHVILFGTPSAGLIKATLFSFLKLQIRNMSATGEFIQALRSDWSRLKLNETPPFRFLTVAGELDQFVPPISSLDPFPEPMQRVIPGNHLSMLRADSPAAPCVQVVIQILTQQAASAGPRIAAELALERRDFQRVIDSLWDRRTELDDGGARDLALALDSLGRQQDAIQVLEGHTPQGTDILGVLAGRYKRRWLVERRRSDVERAVELYREGYRRATIGAPDHGQAFYHGINLAFLELAYGSDYHAASAMATAVLEHCELEMHSKDVFWCLTTQGDALMILGQADQAFEMHSKASKCEMSPWQALSIQEQAIRTADLCGWAKDDISRLSGLYEGEIE